MDRLRTRRDAQNLTSDQPDPYGEARSCYERARDCSPSGSQVEADAVSVESAARMSDSFDRRTLSGDVMPAREAQP